MIFFQTSDIEFLGFDEHISRCHQVKPQPCCGHGLQSCYNLEMKIFESFFLLPFNFMSLCHFLCPICESRDHSVRS